MSMTFAISPFIKAKLPVPLLLYPLPAEDLDWEIMKHLLCMHPFITFLHKPYILINFSLSDLQKMCMVIKMVRRQNAGGQNAGHICIGGQNVGWFSIKTV